MRPVGRLDRLVWHIPEPEAGPGHTLHDVSTAGVNLADTHHVSTRN